MMGRRGHTTPADIAKVERLSFLMARRMEGLTFGEIGRMLEPPITAQAVHRAFWKVMRSHPFDDRARRRRQAARAERDDLIT